MVKVNKHLENLCTGTIQHYEALFKLFLGILSLFIKPFNGSPNPPPYSYVTTSREE